MVNDSDRPLGQTRQVTIDALCEHFANDALAVEEFERRVDLAHRAESVDDLKTLLRDLPGGNLPAQVDPTPDDKPVVRGNVTAAAHVKAKDFVVAILGGASRAGAWTPARKTFSVSVMGGTKLDFREATFGPGVTELHVFTIMGGVDVIVPPGVRVEAQGIGIMGGFDQVTDIGTEELDVPTLRVTGVALMAGVSITQRYPGESSRDARRRRKLERKERRRLSRGD